MVYINPIFRFLIELSIGLLLLLGYDSAERPTSLELFFLLKISTLDILI